MAETLLELMREAGIVTEPPRRPYAAPRINRPAWEATPDVQQRPRIQPRTMRSPDVRSTDMRLAPAERTRAYQQVQRETERPAPVLHGPFNQIEDARLGAREMLGIGPLARVAADVQDGPERIGQDGRPRTLGDTATDAAFGGLGVLSLVPALPRGVRPPVRSASRTPPRVMAEAPRPLPQRPVPAALDAGQANGGAPSGEQWVDVFTGQRGDPNRPWRGHQWTTRERGVAQEYGPNVRHQEGNIGGAPTIRTEADLRRLLGDRANEVMATRRRSDMWAYLDDPAVRAALQERGVRALRVPDDMLPNQPDGPRDAWHESYLFLDEGALRSPGGGNASAGQAIDAPSVSTSSASALPDGSAARPPPDLSKATRRPNKPTGSGGFRILGAPPSGS